MSTDQRANSTEPSPPSQRLGVQLFTLASMVARDLDAALKLSEHEPIFIFKHSTRCPKACAISSGRPMWLES